MAVSTPGPDEPLNILISGGGIAGFVLAFWLLKLNTAGTPKRIHLTIIERAPAIRLTGASVDIRGAAVDIIRAMNLEEKILENVTHEAGIEFVDNSGKAFAKFGATGSTEVQSFTSEFEIFRGALNQIFYESVKDSEDVEFVFGDYVRDVKQVVDDGDGARVEVTLMHSEEKKTYDLVVAADGLYSKIRDMMLKEAQGEEAVQECFHPLNLFCSYFTFKGDLLKGSLFAKWYNATDGRVTFIRPDPAGNTRGNLIVVTDGDPKVLARHRDALNKGNKEYKALMDSVFADAGWLAAEVLKGMNESEDYYCSEVAQIRTDTLWHGRVVLLGDAGYCPTPLTGFGTSLAIIGGYVLAGEILRSAGDVETALASYQDLMLPYVKKVQYMPVAPQYLNPRTGWGLSIMRNVMWFVTWTRLDKLMLKLASLPSLQPSKFEMPEYEWPRAG